MQLDDVYVEFASGRETGSVDAVTFRKDVAGWRHSGRLPKE
jgi:hypothetical protein